MAHDRDFLASWQRGGRQVLAEEKFECLAAVVDVLVSLKLVAAHQTSDPSLLQIFVAKVGLELRKNLGLLFNVVQSEH